MLPGHAGAGAVGIKAASLYNHFEGKQGLFDALIERETPPVQARELCLQHTLDFNSAHRKED